jgi:hypothetical protein
VTVIIAVYVAFIGTFQWFTAREKLRLYLYTPGVEVYPSALAGTHHVQFHCHPLFRSGIGSKSSQ